jgi:succinate dehydrogenase/fumarate reductase flavoprotein subunit
VSVDRDETALAIRQTMREIMRDDVSVVRSAASLEGAIAALYGIVADPALDANTLDAITTRTMALLAREIATSALNRRESRGGHFRSDRASTDPDLDSRHQLVTRQADGAIARTFAPLDVAWAEAAANATSR